MEEKRDCIKEDVLRMLKEINDIQTLKLIYGFVKAGYNEEKGCD